MKITGLKTFVVHASRANFVFLKIYTDAGYEGVGEATLEWRTLTVVAAIEELREQLIGQNPFAIEFLFEKLYKDSYWRTGAVLRTALAAVEAALFDIKGKALNVPVYELLGGKQRDTVPCYGNNWFFSARTPDEFAERAKQAVALGFKALKWDPFEASDLEMDRAQRGRTIAIVEAVRAAVGPDVDLMLDLHGRLNVPTAIAMARELHRFDLRWIEEPVPPESIDALAEVRAKSPVQIAAGERLFEPERFLELIHKRAADILQPDVGHVGGLSEARKIAGLAHMRFLPIAPHNPTGPVMNAMTLHVAASIANMSVLETLTVDVPWRHEIARGQLEFRDGAMTIPDRPGLGIEIDEEACGKYPYRPVGMPLFNGQLTMDGAADGVPIGEG